MCTEPGKERVGRTCKHNTLPCVKQIARGKLLCDTGGSTQCPVTTSRGGTESEVGGRFNREGTHILVADPRCCMPETNTTTVKQLSPMKTEKLRELTVKERRLKSVFFSFMEVQESMLKKVLHSQCGRQRTAVICHKRKHWARL